ncbi:rod-determining factor RdfA [Halorientalis salina]|uniref:rod-determining factor RdfA n=1 Tax=Halorientalis salina TaxID=2932266 RepID=UPI0010ACB95C|nr:rod-determining factor RdfA [Halorientalis salina]
MVTENDDEGSTAIDSKVARLIDDYSLGEAYGDRLEALWTADGSERESLRALADRFNERLLEAAITDAGMSTVDGEVANIYRLLTDDDVSSGNRIEARRRLEQHDVDVDKLEQDFVTYQAIRSYLKEYRDARYEGKNQADRKDSVIDTIQRLKSRTRSVAEQSLDQLRGADRITLGEFRLFLDISVHCEECNTQYEFVELIKRGGCDCQSE